MEMKDVNLKIRIKEVTEKMRELTIEERCLVLVTVAQVPGCSKECRAEASAKLVSIGFVSSQGTRFVSSLGTLGKFRTETIRDATPEEHRAWAYLQLKGHCTCTERKLSSVDCDDCFLSGACIASDYKTGNAIYILKDKEIILELV